MKHQAIITKFLSPTNTKSSRIKATCYAKSITISYDHTDKNPHATAAASLIRETGWYGRWVSGCLPKGDGDAFVCIQRKLKGIRINGVVYKATLDCKGFVYGHSLQTPDKMTNI